MGEAKQDIKNPPRFQDVNLALVERIAESMSEGWAKYEQDLGPEEKNYLKADLKFALGRIGNALKHLYSYNEVVLAALRGGEMRLDLSSEDHLGHCAANLNLLAKYEEIGLLPNTRIKFKVD